MIEHRISRNEGLARHTTLRIGGAADYFLRVDSRDEIIEAVRWARDKHLDIFILGKGSNILVSDAGMRGLVIENHADRVGEIRKQVDREIGKQVIGNEAGKSLEREQLEDKSRERGRVIIESGASLPGL